MSFMDVTLRDGGLKISFDWPFDYAVAHYSRGISEEAVQFVELGYWKQNIKYQSPYFRIDEKFLEYLTSGNTAKACVMIDFHYCSKNLLDYPPSGSAGSPMLYRLTCRKVDVEKAIVFATMLRNHTGTKVSINFSNTSNLSDEEVISFAEKASVSGLDFAYFADSHGALNLEARGEIFQQAVEILTQGNVEAGIHLHNHNHLALRNFSVSKELGFSVADASFSGLGKGGGNLRVEDVISIDYSLALAELWSKFGIQATSLLDFYYYLSGKLSTVDHYADWAWENKLSPKEFYTLLGELKTSQREEVPG